LNDLEEFVKVTDAGLQREVTEGDYCVLVEIMGYLLAVKQTQTTADELFEPLKEMVELLESYGQKMPGEVYAQLKELPEKWNAVEKRAMSVKHKVTSLQASEVAVIRRKCISFDGKQMEFRQRFKKEAPFQFDVENAYAPLDKSSIDDWAKTQWRQINVEQMDVELGRFAKA
ncbi:PREDICTED: dynein heavy chain 11, axonemal-like, partial [Fulmarus glacialis]|uniref:dynein heavy chain 11, axonemal-like n=1 Tax=Fulmarus glacialis TaxID=30455 RepID=UPI00051C5DB3